MAHLKQLQRVIYSNRRVSSFRLQAWAFLLLYRRMEKAIARSSVALEIKRRNYLSFEREALRNEFMVVHYRRKREWERERERERGKDLSLKSRENLEPIVARKKSERSKITASKRLAVKIRKQYLEDPLLRFDSRGRLYWAWKKRRRQHISERWPIQRNSRRKRIYYLSRCSPSDWLPSRRQLRRRPGCRMHS